MESVSCAFGYSPTRLCAAASRPGSSFGMVWTSGSATYLDIDSGVAVAVVRNPCDPDFTAITCVDEIVADAYHPRSMR